MSGSDGDRIEFHDNTFHGTVVGAEYHHHEHHHYPPPHPGQLVEGGIPQRPARPLSEVTDPFQLEVHRAIEVGTPALPTLPAYVPREHDRALGEVVARAAAGASGIAVLVGGSSTGKTRACWEALTLLRERDEPWQVWHPIEPTRPDAALAGLRRIGPHTVIWLNEAQFYLADPALGERVAAGLRELLRAPDRGPVLVLATLWPDHWDTLTTRAEPDAHAQARELLDGRTIKVPDAFTGADLDALVASPGHARADPRLSEAAAHAEDGQVTQYLAGVPVLMDRYEHAPATAKAMIHAAMDARRLGAGPHLPLALLAEAAPGYLTDTQWNQTGEDWVQQALDCAATPCNGIPGILVPVKTGTARNQRSHRTHTAISPAAGPRARAGQGPHYRLADYLDQHGRHHRADQIPPIDFWTAAAAHAHPGDQATLGDTARLRGLYRDAAQLHKNATTHGDPRAADALVTHLHTLYPADPRPAHHAASHSPLDDPRAVTRLLDRLRGSGAHEQATELLARNPAAHAALDNPGAVAVLLTRLHRMGAHEQVAALAERAAAHTLLEDPGAVAVLLNRLGKGPLRDHAAVLAERAAAHATLNSPGAVAQLLDQLARMGAHEQVSRLLARNPAAHAVLDAPGAVAHLLGRLGKIGAHEQAATLAERAATHTAVDDPGTVAQLLIRLRKIGTHEQAATLAERAATHTALDDPGAVAQLLDQLARMRAHEQAAILAERAATHTALDDPGAVAQLLDQLRKMGAHEQVSMLLAGNPAAHVALDDPRAVARRLGRLGRMGAREQVAALLARNPAAHASLDDPGAVAGLLTQLDRMRAHEQLNVLLARNPAAHAALNNPRAVAGLLDQLHRMRAHEQLNLLAERAAAHTPLVNAFHVRVLLDRLCKVGTIDHVTTLAERLPAAGRFDQFMDIDDRSVRFRFGREPDGRAATSWGWDDLE